MSWIFARRVLILMPTSPSFEEQIRAYNEELRRYYAQSHAAIPPSEPEDVNKSDAARNAAEPHTDMDLEMNRVDTETEAGAETEILPEMTAAEKAPDNGHDRESDVEDDRDEMPAPPVERPWEAIRTEEWMAKKLNPWAGTAEFADDGSMNRQAPPFGYNPPQAVENDAGGEKGEVSAVESDESSEADGRSDAVNSGGDGGENENSDIGFLQVRVFSARGAVPLVGAIVSIIGHNAAGQETLLHMERTDQSGIAPQVSLPTPDRALSYKPGDATPFLNYIVQVSAPGYVTIRNERVAVYGGVTSLQGVPMIPLPEPQADYQNEVVVRPGGAPPELN
ncbi:MAG: hypothetical protein IKI63_05190 [Clostridia bacterium]|nr:hypothetical protein [Clostridia bacterium]